MAREIFYLVVAVRWVDLYILQVRACTRFVLSTPGPLPYTRSLEVLLLPLRPPPAWWCLLSALFVVSCGRKLQERVLSVARRKGVLEVLSVLKHAVFKAITAPAEDTVRFHCWITRSIMLLLLLVAVVNDFGAA